MKVADYIKKTKASIVLLSILFATSISGCSYNDIQKDMDKQNKGKDSIIIVERVKRADAEETEWYFNGFLNDNAYEYVYGTLNTEEQILYNEIKELLGSMGEYIEIDVSKYEMTVDEEQLNKIFNAVIMDHPELFYVEGYQSELRLKKDKLISIKLCGNYSSNYEQAMSKKRLIDKEVENVLKGIENLSSDYEKIKYIFDYIVISTEYSLNASDNQNIYSVFVNHSSVCQGYSKALQYLCNEVGIECILAKGYFKKEEPHTWNIVNINGNYYGIDVTQGDSSYEEHSAPWSQAIIYDYFCVTSEELAYTHTASNDYELPKCENTDCNYYRKEGLYLESYDEQKIDEILKELITTNKNVVTLRFETKEDYSEAYEHLVVDSYIVDYIKHTDAEIFFKKNDSLHILTFWIM